jgi:DNA-binding NarL/FixJ family response regulator
MTRILVADPDPAARRALALVFRRKFGAHEICEAGDRETLEQYLMDCSPDLLVLDQTLAGHPAVAACSRYRRMYPSLHIALMSVDAEDASAALQAGAVFLYKGALADEVLSTLEPFFSSPTGPLPDAEPEPAPGESRGGA